MSTFAPAAPAIDPNEIIVSDEIQPITIAPCGYHASLLWDRDLRQKAIDYENCGKLGQSFGCSNHEHGAAKPEIVGHVVFTCKQRFSRCCNGRVTTERMEKHAKFINMIKLMDHSEFPRSVSVIRILKPCVDEEGLPDAERALALARTVKQTLRRLARNGPLPNYYVKSAVRGFVGNSVDIMGLYWGSHLAPSEIRSALLPGLRLDADVEVTAESPSSAYELFEQLLKIIVPEDETLSAELEARFHRQDMLFQSKRLDEEELEEAFSDSFPSTEDQGNEMKDHGQICDNHYQIAIPRCLKCGRRADMISKMHPRHATMDEIHQGRWDKISEIWH